MNNPRRYNLEEALNLSDIDYDIHLHDGLIDASNTALLFKKIKTEKGYTKRYDEDSQSKVVYFLRRKGSI